MWLPDVIMNYLCYFQVLYVDAVRFFPEKLQDFHDLLMEKELRIRAPVEEIELIMKGWMYRCSQ